MAVFPDIPPLAIVMFLVWITGGLWLGVHIWRKPPPPSIEQLQKIIELYAELPVAEQEKELAMLRERVKARRQR